MRHSTRDIAGTQIAGLLFAALVFVSLLLAGTAESAMLPAVSVMETALLDPAAIDAAPCYAGPDGTFEIGVYAAAAACRTMTVCLGVPVSLSSVVGPGRLVLLEPAPRPEVPEVRPSLRTASRTRIDTSRTPASGHR